MSSQKQTIYDIGLITKEGKEVISPEFQEKAGYAFKDMCSKNGWGCIAYVVDQDCARVMIAVPEDTQAGIILSSVKTAIAESVFLSDPELKSRLKGDLWSHNSVMLEGDDNDALMSQRLEQAKKFAQSSPGINLH